MTDGATASAFSFQGRIGRAAFWAVIATTFIAAVLFVVLATLLLPSFSATKVNPGGSGWMTGVVGLVYFLLAWVSLATYAKRLHDLDHTGWLTLLAFVPLINLIMLIYCGAKPGTPGPNRFGPGPVRVTL